MSEMREINTLMRQEKLKTKEISRQNRKCCDWKIVVHSQVH